MFLVDLIFVVLEWWGVVLSLCSGVGRFWCVCVVLLCCCSLVLLVLWYVSLDGDGFSVVGVWCLGLDVVGLGLGFVLLAAVVDP